MSNRLAHALTDFRFRFQDWTFVDLRIDIPPKSFGSDAINPHTQYSNAIALFDKSDVSATGASFTLGAGNEMICKAAEFILRELDGISVAELMSSNLGFYESLTNPLQLRWLSPNAGVPLMAGGLIVNTLIDAASKTVGLPAWEYLARLPSDLLMSLINLRHLDDRYNPQTVFQILERGLLGIDERCSHLKAEGFPVYYTTWIGHDSDTIASQILTQYKDRGIKIFKLKVGPDITRDIQKLKLIQELVPKDVELCVDANQTLTLEQAKQWLLILSNHHVKWLEEPFAPDNIYLFQQLMNYKRQNDLICEVVTGENCPNHYTAAALMDCGIDRFQSDPCRMLGMIDCILSSVIASVLSCSITPHAGGSSLDELSPHIQLFNLARIRTDLSPADTLVENVGFCSRFFASPTVVERGRARTQVEPGLLVGLSQTITPQIRGYQEGITWLEL